MRLLPALVLRTVPIGTVLQGFFQRAFTCARNPSHTLSFFCRVSQFTVQKAGQLPSLADLAQAELQKYRPVLKDDYPEFARGVGLAAHGVRIGAFVYLRRVFESMIEEAHSVAKTVVGWEEDAFSKQRMAEKIEVLSDHLPKFPRRKS